MKIETILAIMAIARQANQLATDMTAAARSAGELSQDELHRIRDAADVSDAAWDAAVQAATDRITGNRGAD